MSMWIRSFQLQHYSTFEDTGVIELGRGFNFFAGQNNAGKSALLKALSLQISGNRHRSNENFVAAQLPASVLKLRIATTVEEIVDRFSAKGKSVIFPFGDGNRQHQIELARILNSRNELTLNAAVGDNGAISRDGRASIPSLAGNPNTGVVGVRKENGKFAKVSAGGQENLVEILEYGDEGSIFYFSPERLNVASFQFSEEKRLQSNASNMPAVLAYLQGARRSVFDEIEANLIEILPGISRMTVAPEGNRFQVLLWPTSDTDRREIAFTLNESGTGVGQLLAILTAVISSEQSIIIIDEINTFLHPSASKKLLRLLRSEYGHHQYIISTHSSDVLSSAIADRVFLLRRDGFKGSLEQVDLSDFSASREVAAHLGFSMMDVFGHERLIWVEGQTEELCFPYLYRQQGLDLEGVGIVAVASTADFSNRGASRKSIIDLYDRVAKTAAPLLKGMAFGLDREDLSEDAVKSLEKSKRKLRFLPRRALENYLIHPSEIAQLLAAMGEKDVTAESVREWFGENGGSKEFSAASLWNGDISKKDWLVRVDAPKMLAKLFQQLTENRFEYRKTTHTLELLKLALDRGCDDIAELVEYAGFLLEVARRDTPP